MADPTRMRSVISLGLPPEVRKIVEDFHGSVGVDQSIADSIRELILRGAGVESDVAMLAMQRRQIRRIAEKFLLARVHTFAASLETELKAYIDSALANDGGFGEPE